MNRLQAIQVCREVARQGGFAAAGRKLNISTPSVSRLVGDIEDDLGLRLFHRSTRKISLTEEGTLFLNGAAALVDELDVLCGEMRALRTEPRGHLRVNSVLAFGQEMIAPVVPGFLARYPAVTVDLEMDNRHVDLIQDGYDLAIRVGGQDGLTASGLIARKIYAQKLIFVASPEYIQRHGQPDTLEAIEQHLTVKQVVGTWGIENRLVRQGKTINYRMPGSFVVNTPTAAVNAVSSGHALGLIGDFLAAGPIARGELCRVLPDYETEDQPLYAVYAHRSYMPAKLRVFIDYLVEMLGNRTHI